MIDKKLYIISIVILGLIHYGCSNSQKVSRGLSENGAEYINLSVNISPEFYDSIFNTLSAPEFIVLKESDNIMFSEINKIVATGNRYYVMDAFGATTVVSFDSNGNAYASYGRVGQGPGEYVRPRDIDVDSEYVYVLDSNLKKLIQYDLEGKFIHENGIPFYADGFKKLKDGEFIFNLSPDGGEASPRLCLSDSQISDFEYFLCAPAGYLGGVITDNNFRTKNNETTFYQAPSDTIYNLSDAGKITGGLVLDFGKFALPDEAKVDYMAARTKELLDDSMILYDNPIQLDNGLAVGTVTADNSQYTIIFDINSGSCGARKFQSESSVYDILELSTTDDIGRLVCYTTTEFIKKAVDYDSLPDSIKSELDKDSGYYVIGVYSFNQ